MVRRCRSGMRPDQPIPPLDPKPVTVTKPIEVLSAQRKEAGAKLGQANATLDQARVRSRQDRGQGADGRRDPQGQCAAR